MLETFSRQPSSFTFMIYETIIHTIPLVLGILKFGLLFFSVNISIENFVQISILLDKTNIVEIVTQFFISSRSHFGDTNTRGILRLLTQEFYFHNFIFE